MFRTSLFSAFFKNKEIKLKARMTLAIFLMTISTVGCLSQKMTGSVNSTPSIDGVGDHQGWYCERTIIVSAHRVKQISITKASDCSIAQLEYVSLMSGGRSARLFLDFWNADGRKHIAVFSASRGEEGLARAITSGLNPALIEAEKNQDPRPRIRIHFELNGFNYEVILNAENLKPVGMSVWQ